VSSIKKGNPTKESYHHGDLRNALLQGAIAHIRDQGVQNLSLRDLARELGVSHAAPYRHFADKQVLLVTIAEDGYAQLLASMERSMGAVENVLAQLEELAWAYVGFSLNNPVQAEVMFGTELSERSRFPTLEAAADQVFALAQTTIERGQRQGVIVEGSSALLGATAWSMVHGLAMLLNSKRMRWKGGAEEEQRQLTLSVVRNLLHGILVKPATPS
jgi:AcrR family transcriptional regulator